MSTNMDTAGQGEHESRRGIDAVVQRALGVLRDPAEWRRELWPWFTAAGRALAFDLGVFAMLVLLGLRLLLPWEQALDLETRLMLTALFAIAFLWVSISEPDWRRFRVLRRRWQTQAARRIRATPQTVNPLMARTLPARTKPPVAVMPRVRSVYRPQRATLSSHWAWRVSGRGR